MNTSKKSILAFVCLFSNLTFYVDTTVSSKLKFIAEHKRLIAAAAGVGTFWYFNGCRDQEIESISKVIKRWKCNDFIDQEDIARNDFGKMKSASKWSAWMTCSEITPHKIYQETIDANVKTKEDMHIMKLIRDAIACAGTDIKMFVFGDNGKPIDIGKTKVNSQVLNSLINNIRDQLLNLRKDIDKLDPSAVKEMEKALLKYIRDKQNKKDINRGNLYRLSDCELTEALNSLQPKQPMSVLQLNHSNWWKAVWHWYYKRHNAVLSAYKDLIFLYAKLSILPDLISRYISLSDTSHGVGSFGGDLRRLLTDSRIDLPAGVATAPAAS